MTRIPSEGPTRRSRYRWLILFAVAAVSLLVYFVSSHSFFQKAIVSSLREEQAFVVRLMIRVIDRHITESGQNLKHLDSMIREGTGGGPDYERHASMVARDHEKDFSSILVSTYDGELLYHSRGESGTDPLAPGVFDKGKLEPGAGFLISERISRNDGKPTTLLCYAPPLPERGGAPYFICGELNLEAFLEGELKGHLGNKIGFVVADYFGDIYVVSCLSRNRTPLMERGKLFDLDHQCLECHNSESFSDIKRAVETERIVHRVFRNPAGRYFNRTSASFPIYNERWIVSTSHPYENIQEKIVANSKRNAAITLLFLTFLGVATFRLHRIERRQALIGQYYRVIDTISVGVFRMDEESRIISANPAMTALLGVSSRDDLVGTSFLSWCHDPGQTERGVRKLRRVGQIEDYDLVIRRSDGSLFPASLSSSAARDEDTGMVTVDAVLLDITPRKTAENDLKAATEELERQNWELKQLDRMKDKLVRDVSHELKTPVAKISMQIEILKPLLEKHSLTEGERNALAVIETSIGRQQAVIRNLLDLARLESGVREYRKEEVRLDRFFQELEADFRPILDAYRVAAAINVPPLTIESDREMLWHVFTNLLQNAVNFRRDEGPEIVIGVEKREGEVVVRVADNGKGMEGGDLEKAFSRFYQASASTEGSGVGLTICRRITRDLGGRIWLESEGKGKGVTAFVVLPSS